MSSSTELKKTLLRRLAIRLEQEKAGRFLLILINNIHCLIIIIYNSYIIVMLIYFFFLLVFCFVVELEHPPSSWPGSICPR